MNNNMKKNKVKKLTSLSDLFLILSDSEKRELEIEQQKRIDQLIEANNRIAKLHTGTLGSSKGAFQ